MTHNRARSAQFQNEMIPHMDLMFNYALYLTSDREAAGDLLQETFLKAFRFYDKFEAGSNARAWLYRIMRNTYINEYRRIKRLPALVQYDEQTSTSRMVPVSEGKVTHTREDDVMDIFEDEVAAALASLPEKFKSVVVLRDVEELPYEEIAEALGIPIGTVRSRLHRARLLLHDRLKQYARNLGYTVADREFPADAALAV